MKRIKSVVFDCYGTLYLFGNMKKAWIDWVNVFYKSATMAGMCIKKEEFFNAVDGFMSRPKPTEINSGFTLFEQRVKNKLREFNCFFPDETIKSIAQSTVEAWHNEIEIDPETTKILSSLSIKLPVSLLSNFDHPKQIYEMLKKDKIFNYFEEIIISGEVGVDKPDPKIFEFLFEKNNLSPEEILYVGDSEEDYLGAKAAGTHFLLIRRNSNSQNKIANDYQSDITNIELDWTNNYKKPTERISSLSELLTYVENNFG